MTKRFGKNNFGKKFCQKKNLGKKVFWQKKIQAKFFVPEFLKKNFAQIFGKKIEQKKLFQGSTFRVHKTGPFRQMDPVYKGVYTFTVPYNRSLAPSE